MTWPTPHGPGFLFSAETGCLMLAALQQILKEKTFHPASWHHLVTTWLTKKTQRQRHNRMKITKIHRSQACWWAMKWEVCNTDNYILIQCGAVVLAILHWNRAPFEWSAISLSQDSGMMPNHTTLLLGCSSCFFCMIQPTTGCFVSKHQINPDNRSRQRRLINNAQRKVADWRDHVWIVLRNNRAASDIFRLSRTEGPTKMVEGSLEAKLTTIWTDEKQGRGREKRKIRREKIREEKESEERRCRCAKR